MEATCGGVEPVAPSRVKWKGEQTKRGGHVSTCAEFKRVALLLQRRPPEAFMSSQPRVHPAFPGLDHSAAAFTQ